MNDVHNDMDFRESDWEAALGALEQAEAAQRKRRRKAILWWSTATVAAIVLGVLFLGTDEQTDYIPRSSAVATGAQFAEVLDSLVSSDPASALAEAATSSDEAPRTTATERQEEEGAVANLPSTSPATAAAPSGDQGRASAEGENTRASSVVNAPVGESNPSIESDQGRTSAEGENPVKLPEIANNASILWVEQAPTGGVNRMAPLKLQPVKNARTAGELLTPKLKLRKRFPIPAKTYNLVGYVGNTFAFGYGKVKGTGVVDPALGLTGEIRLINRTWLRTGVGLFQVNNVFSRKEYREEQASFGLNYTSTLISTDRLYMVDLPLGVVIDLNQHHGLVVGTGMEMLLTTRNQLQERQVTPFSTSVLEERNDFGYRTGYTSMNGYVQLGYRYRLTRRSSFDAVYSTGWRRMHEFNNIRNARLVMRFNYALK
ncbi:MAG: hypothetical protein ACFCUH_08765 [Flavobacteriales bacterium]